MSQPFAVFDIDGTIIRWQLYHALADELAKENIRALLAVSYMRRDLRQQ